MTFVIIIHIQTFNGIQALIVTPTWLPIIKKNVLKLNYVFESCISYGSKSQFDSSERVKGSEKLIASFPLIIIARIIPLIISQFSVLRTMYFYILVRTSRKRMRVCVCVCALPYINMTTYWVRFCHLFLNSFRSEYFSLDNHNWAAPREELISFSQQSTLTCSSLLPRSETLWRFHLSTLTHLVRGTWMWCNIS